MSVLRAIGDIRGARYLCDTELIQLLYELAERSGMSWWKGRWKRVEQQLHEAGRSEQEIETLALEHGRDAPAVAPAHEGRQLAQSKFQTCFGRTGTTSIWLDWATERGLVVKGVEVKCPHCSTVFWLPVQEMSPPHTCPGCSRTIARPFRSDVVQFKYRIGEVLRQCLDADALGHVLALYWLTEAFADRGLVGAHPGVEFHRDKRVAAEADVVLLFDDGGLVPVEVKRRATGFDKSAIDRLDAVSGELHAPFDVMCTTEPKDKCAALIPFTRELPSTPRFLLTMDQLAARHVAWTIGSNPFEENLFEDSDGDVEETKHRRREQWLAEIDAIGSYPDDPAEATVRHWRAHPGGIHDQAPPN